MDKKEVVILAIIVAAGFIVAGIVYKNYDNHPYQIEPTIIELSPIPYSSEKVDDIENVNASSRNITYGKGQQEGFISVPVYNLTFFKNKELDKVYVSFGRDMYTRGVISIRGINNSELPNVHAYKETVIIEDVKPAFTAWIFQAVWYNSVPSLDRSEHGWLLSIKHSKQDVGEAISISVIFGIIGSVVMYVIILVVLSLLRLFEYIISKFK